MQVVPVCSSIPTDRIPIGRGEHFRRKLPPHRFEDFEFAVSWHSGGGKFGSFKIAGNTLVLTVEDLLVDAFKIEGEIERATKLRLLEFAPAEVECEGLHNPDIADREFLKNNALLLNRGKIISG